MDNIAIWMKDKSNLSLNLIAIVWKTVICIEASEEIFLILSQNKIKMYDTFAFRA